MTITPSFAMWITRIREDGSVHIPSDEVPGELTEFRRQLRRAANSAGIRLRTSHQGGWFLAWDPDFVVSEERMRAIVDAVALDLPATDPDCPNCGTRATPHGGSWRCRTCGIAVLG